MTFATIRNLKKKYLMPKKQTKTPIYFMVLRFFLFKISRGLSVKYILVQLQIISNPGSSTPRKGVGMQY